MLRVLYAGSPEASAKTLELLLKDSLTSTAKDEYRIVGVLTNPPSAQGRHKELIPTEVEKTARLWNETHDDEIKVFTPEHLMLRAENQSPLFHPDIFVCFAYGHIFGPKFFHHFVGRNQPPSVIACQNPWLHTGQCALA